MNSFKCSLIKVLNVFSHNLVAGSEMEVMWFVRQAVVLVTAGHALSGLPLPPSHLPLPTTHPKSSRFSTFLLYRCQINRFHRLFLLFCVVELREHNVYANGVRKSIRLLVSIHYDKLRILKMSYLLLPKWRSAMLHFLLGRKTSKHLPHLLQYLPWSNIFIMYSLITGCKLSRTWKWRGNKGLYQSSTKDQPCNISIHWCNKKLTCCSG